MSVDKVYIVQCSEKVIRHSCPTQQHTWQCHDDMLNKTSWIPLLTPDHRYFGYKKTTRPQIQQNVRDESNIQVRLTFFMSELEAHNLPTRGQHDWYPETDRTDDVTPSISSRAFIMNHCQLFSGLNKLRESTNHFVTTPSPIIFRPSRLLSLPFERGSHHFRMSLRIKNWGLKSPHKDTLVYSKSVQIIYIIFLMTIYGHY